MFDRVPALRATILSLLLSAAAPAMAQEVVAPPTPLADALAREVRTLAANPRDLRALIAAGDLSTQLGDPAAAIAFFGRASAIAPSDPRIAAGRAGAYVLLERPGEALRLYEIAERAGVSMRPYAAQRGLAYDLTGQPGFAQRDYRTALSLAPSDETTRRLALSLGISGQASEAMTLLDPLLRRSDRAAWRARAFILAMTGDVAGSERIAISMVPGGAALGPFLRRLATLPPADRAYAVHFGELNTSVARQNDARLAPAVAALPASPPSVAGRVEVASNRRPSRSEQRRIRREQERERRRQPVAVAARAPQPYPAPAPPAAPPVLAPVAASAPPVQLAAAAPASTPSYPAPFTSAPQGPGTWAPSSGTNTAAQPASPSARVAAVGGTGPASPTVAAQPARTADAVAAANIRSATPQGWSTSNGSTLATGQAPWPASPAPVQTASPLVTTSVAPASPAPQPAASAAAAGSSTAAPAGWAATPQASVVGSGAAQTTASVAQGGAVQPQADQTPRADAGVVVGDTAPAQRAITRIPIAPSDVAPAPTPAAPVALASVEPPVRARPSALDAIVGSIAVPASELDVEPITPPAPPPAAPAETAEETPERRAEPPVVKKATAEPRKTVAEAPEPKRPDPKKAKAEAAALAAKKAKDDAARQKAEEARAEARKAKADPARWFVQVAGGARVDDLDKDWKRLSAKSPAAFRGKTAYTAPLRATNRLLAGPFKSEADARSFVNRLAKDGTSAFTFQSEAGQKISKVPLG